MKNVSYVINGILAVAVIILFVLFFTSNKTDKPEGASSLNFNTKNDSSAVLPIAYVNIDSLLLNYNFYKDSNEALMKRYNNSSNILKQKQNQFEQEIREFQRKSQNNAFLSPERAQQEQTNLQKLESELGNLARRYENEYIQEQARMNAQIADSVRLCLTEYNKTANYQVIFSNTAMDNILIAKDNYDITSKIVQILNNRYKPETTK